jgi:superfamily II DNA or RNA helicase
MTTVKPSAKLTLHDRLSRLSFEQACKLLGPEGKKLILQGSRRDVDVHSDVYLGGDLLRVTFRQPNGHTEAVTTLTMMADSRDRLHWNCDRCFRACVHVGAMFSVVLEDKLTLGLAAAPPERELSGELTEDQLVQRALADREQRARTERMKLRSADGEEPWTEYTVTSLVSGKSYFVSLRGLEPGQSYCSCPDYRTNTLGTCKHVMKVIRAVQRKFKPAQLQKPYRWRRIEVLLRYGEDVTLHVVTPERLPEDVEALVRPFAEKPIDKVSGLLRMLAKLEAMEQEYHVTPDAEEFIQQRLHRDRLRALVEAIRADPARHPLRTTLLKVPLLPYQLDGIAFAAGAGRAVLADDMGLGKTIQAIGVTELLAQEASLKKVLVICPASLKSQWRNEVQRFVDRDVQLIAGQTAGRADQYRNNCMFTVCNYEQVLKDIQAIEQVPWDLIILDEGQRIKNWEAKTSRVVKGLRSRFALVLSGTPLENRLDELYSVVQFIDDRRLGPGFRFFNQHRIVDEKGHVLGYRNLDVLRERLRPILLRRTREQVRLEVPERTTEIIRIPPTEEQKALHDTHMQTVATIVAKKFLTEMDLLRLRMSLMMCRMAADGTFLVTKSKDEPNFSSKLDRLAGLFDDIAAEPDRKVVLFSEWTTMLDLIEPLLTQRELAFVRLDGSVPQKHRQELVNTFQTDPNCRLFLTTNAGSVGLNLQAANTVINVDLPWNPAVLEQRIGRAHRMGQTQPVQVFVLVTEQTLEENLLATLSAKKELALAALDPSSEVTEVGLQSSAEELKARLEVLLGAKPEAATDRSEEMRQREAAQAHERRERVSSAGGALLGAAFQFMGELVGGATSAAPSDRLVTEVRSRLDQCVETGPDGKPRLTVTLPDRTALDSLAQTLARLLAGAETNAVTIAP